MKRLLTIALFLGLSLVPTTAHADGVAHGPTVSTTTPDLHELPASCCHKKWFHAAHPEALAGHDQHREATRFAPTRSTRLRSLEAEAEPEFQKHLLDAGRRFYDPLPESSNDLVFHPTPAFRAGAIAHRSGFKPVEGFIFVSGSLLDKNHQPTLSGSLSYRFTRSEHANEGEHGEGSAPEPDWFLGAGVHW